MRSALILIALLNGLALNANAQSTASVLADLPQQMRDDIARVCLPVQYQSGAEAYRSCIQEEIVSREQTQRFDSVKNAFAILTFDERYAIQQACGTDSTDPAMRRCTSEQIAELNALPSPRLDTLTSDEQYVMQQTCFPAQSQQGAAAYRQCQLDAIGSISNVPAPNYSALSAVDRNALQLKCSAIESVLSSYRRCVLAGTGAISVSQELPARPSNRVVADATAPKSIANEPAIAVTTAVRIQTNDASAADATSDAPLQDLQNVTTTASIRPRLITPPRDSNSVVETQPLDTESVVEPELGAALPITQTQTETGNLNLEPVSNTEADAQSETEATDSAAEQDATADATSLDAEPVDNTATPQDLQSWLNTLKSSVFEAFTGLSQQGKILLAAIIGMPIALWALLAGRRRRSDSDFDNEGAYSREDLKRRVRARTEPGDIDLDEDDPISANWAAEADSLFDDPPTIRTAALAQERPQERSEGRRQERTQERAPQAAAHVETGYEDTRRVDPSELPLRNDATPQASSQQNTQPGFAGWLHAQPREAQQSLAIEFLTYWIAFGDERYQPSLKVEIFQKTDPSDLDIVKRWVLKEDVYAFADAIDWLQSHTTQIQKEQIVRFLMVLLVNGDRPTPVQNTLLRFLGDAFYLADPTLEELFELDFGAPLPQTPRVDRMAWWDKQDTSTITQWNARQLNNSDAITRHAAQLGLDHDASAEQIESAFDQALARCNLDHFEHLEEREHQLLEGRQARLTQSRNELMEALA